MIRPASRSLRTWAIYSHLRIEHDLAPEALANSKTTTELAELHQAVAPNCPWRPA